MYFDVRSPKICVFVFKEIEVWPKKKGKSGRPSHVRSISTSSSGTPVSSSSKASVKQKSAEKPVVLPSANLPVAGVLNGPSAAVSEVAGRQGTTTVVETVLSPTAVDAIPVSASSHQPSGPITVTPLSLGTPHLTKV